jgi:hypothetical protein
MDVGGFLTANAGLWWNNVADMTASHFVPEADQSAFMSGYDLSRTTVDIVGSSMGIGTCSEGFSKPSSWLALDSFDPFRHVLGSRKVAPELPTVVDNRPNDTGQSGHGIFSAACISLNAVSPSWPQE